MKIELDAQTTEILTVDGVKISFELLKNFAHPDPSKFYQMKREGDVVTVHTLTTVQLQTKFTRRSKF